MATTTNMLWEEMNFLTDQPLNLALVKTKIDSASYLIKQIEICDNELNKINHLTRLEQFSASAEISSWNRQREQFIQSLTKCLKSL